MNDPLVLVRTYSAGVHFGRLASRTGTEVVLRDARRLWRWRGANTLHEVSQRGVSQNFTRISEPVPAITLTQAIEILPISDMAATTLTTRWDD